MTEIPLLLLPGIILPASFRYRALIQELDGVRAVPKDLEVYSAESPPPGYSIETEVEGLRAAADAAGFERFHLYGHSGGGAVAIAFATTYPDRLLTLALDEPAFDLTAEEKTTPWWAELDRVTASSPEARVPAFLRFQLRPGVEPPPPPPGPAPEWMASRPAGIEAFAAAAGVHSIADDRFGRLRVPVYYSYGDLSNQVWEERRDRLAARFPDFTSELYEGCSHLNTSHQRYPGRVAAALRKLWARA
ncbi:MAG: hypothetical protein NVS9B1_24830 [Candidatus Dormibacteraceae bacterium]